MSEIARPVIPSDLLTALIKRRLTYTRPTTVYHMVWSSGYSQLVGVFGDGANGAYEWFIWDSDTKTLRTSNCGFGSDNVALCSGLVESGESRANGDHDLFLMWGRKTSTAPSAPSSTAVPDQPTKKDSQR